MVNVRTSVAGGDGPAGQMDASPRDTNARAPMPTRVEAQIQSAIESLLLADSMLKGDQEDDDDPELRELRTRWMSERARLLDQQMRVDSLAREYSQRKARRVKQRETERQQQLFAMERRLRELHDEVNSLRGQQGSPNALPGAQHALVSRGSPSRYGASPQQASTDRFFAQQQQQHALTPPGAVRSASAAAATRAPAGSPGPYVASGLPPSFSPLAERADGDRRTPPRPGARGGVSELAKLRRELAHVKAEQSQYAPPVPAAAVGPVGVPSPADAAQQGNVARGSGAAAASAAMAAEPNGFGRARRGPGAVGGVDGSGGSSPCPPIAAPPTTEASAASASARRLLRSASGPGLLPEQQPSPHAQQQPPNQHAPNGSANGVGGGVPSSMRARQPTAVNRSGSGGPSQPGSRRTSNAGAAARVSPRAPELLVPRPPPPPALGPPAVVQRMEGRHTAAVTSVSPTDWEGCMLSAGGDGFVQLWERRQPHDGGADAGWAAGARLSCRAGNVNALAHVPGAHMVVAGCEDGTCRIFRLSGASDDDPRAGYSMYTLRSLKGHTGEVMALASLSWCAHGPRGGSRARPHARAPRARLSPLARAAPRRAHAALQAGLGLAGRHGEDVGPADRRVRADAERPQLVGDGGCGGVRRRLVGARVGRAVLPALSVGRRERVAVGRRRPAARQARASAVQAARRAQRARQSAARGRADHEPRPGRDRQRRQDDPVRRCAAARAPRTRQRAR